MRLITAAAVAVALLLAMGAAPSSAAAQTLTVSTTADDAGGICPALPAQPCSLRAAVITNMHDGGGDTVLLPPGRYVLGSTLPLTNAISIQGTGTRSDVVIDGAGKGGVLTVNLNKQANQAATLAHLSVTGASGETAIIAFDTNPLLLDDVHVFGNETDGIGGGLTLAAGASVQIADSLFESNTSNGGGAIAIVPTNARQTLAISDSELRNNIAGPGGGGALLAGFSDVTIDRSRFDGNTGQHGGAIATFTNNGLDPSIILRNSTLDHNLANPFGGGAVDLPTAHSGAMDAESDTLLANTAAGGADFAGTPSSVLLHNSVLGAGTGTACVDGLVVSSLGHNVASDESCRLVATGDRQGVDPRLGSIADNGGPTLTALPLADSPLLDAADPVGCQATDVRAVRRPQGAACDIGAVERAVTGPSASTGPATGTSVSGSVDPGGQPTDVTVEYGPTTGYGTAVQIPAVRGWLPVAVSATLPAPPAGGAIHYRIRAHNGTADAVGADATMTTPAGAGPPVAPGHPRPTLTITHLRVRVLSHGRRAAVLWSASIPGRLRFIVRTRRGRPLGSFGTTSKAGTNSAAVPLRLLRRLRPGSYRLTVTPASGGRELAHAAFALRVTRRGLRRTHIPPPPATR